MTRSYTEREISSTWENDGCSIHLYARNDHAMIESLAAALEANGYSVWWDHDIQGGAAHEAYLKGMFHWYKLTPGDLQHAFDHFNAALALDPDLAQAHFTLATYYTWAAWEWELAREAKTRFVLPSQIAVLYGMANDVEKAVAWREKAFEERDPEMPYQKYLPRFSEAVANPPRTLAIIEAMKFLSID